MLKIVLLLAVVAILFVSAGIFYVQRIQARWERDTYSRNLANIRMGVRTGIDEAFKLAFEGSLEYWATVKISEEDSSVDEIRIGKYVPNTELQVLYLNWRGGEWNSVTVCEGRSRLGQAIPKSYDVADLRFFVQAIFRELQLPRPETRK